MSNSDIIYADGSFDLLILDIIFSRKLKKKMII